MKTIKMLSYAAIILFLGFSISCEGPEGPAGPAGTNGNANVKTITFTNPTTWTPGDYLGIPASTYAHTSNLVTQSILDHGTVLGYFYYQSSWYALPYSMDSGSYWGRITYTYKLNEIKLYSYNSSGPATPGVSSWKFLLITDNTVTTGKSNGNSNVYTELATAGVDINNYYEVCAYYGINPE